MNKYLIILFISLNQIIYAQKIASNQQFIHSLGTTEYSDSPLWHYSNYTSELNSLQHWSCGINYSNPYFLKELQMQSLVFALPFRSNVFALSFEHFGSAKWRETQWAISYAKSLGDYISIGLKVDYYSIFQTEFYGNWHQWLLELSLSAKITDKLNIASSLYNVSFQKFSEHFSLPVIYKLSASYKIEPNLILSLQLQKDLDFPIYYTAMADFKLTRNIFIKTGIGIHPHKAFLGISYRLKNISCQILFSYQQNLGLQPYSHFDYAFKK